MARVLRRLVPLIVVLALGGGVVYALWPRAIEVETGVVARGSMRTTVDEDGKTRIKERYIVSAPLSGRLARITLEEGDAVEVGMVLASIDPSDPGLLDPRARAEAEARVNASEAAFEQAGAALARAEAALELAITEHVRLREAFSKNAAGQQELDTAAIMETIRTRERDAAAFALNIAKFEVELARAALLRTSPRAEGEPDEWRIEIRAPVSGRVLRVLQESSAIVAPGTPLLELGDPRDLELVVDVLSSDAVNIRPGQAASLEQWGGERPLRGLVRLVEPAAFTKISALGVEEQRVNVVIDFEDPPEARAGLGDQFRIEARIATWEGSDVLKVPGGALFRRAGSWAVFRVENGRARVRDVAIGRRNAEEAEAVSGLSDGDRVVVYPGDTVRGGARVRERGE